MVLYLVTTWWAVSIEGEVCCYCILEYATKTHVAVRRGDSVRTRHVPAIPALATFGVYQQLWLICILFCV